MPYLVVMLSPLDETAVVLSMSVSKIRQRCLSGILTLNLYLSPADGSDHTDDLGG